LIWEPVVAYVDGGVYRRLRACDCILLFQIYLDEKLREAGK
jgi:hypothetical protein